MSADATGFVEFQRIADVGVLRFNRPDRRNALTTAMLDRAWHLLHDATDNEDEPPCRAIVLAGEGTLFSSGFDLVDCQRLERGTVDLLVGLSGLLHMLQAMPPVVVAAHGGAIAGACAILTAADVVVADRAAKIGYPVVRLGLSPAISAPTLRAAVGDGRSRERLLDPSLVSGAEAHRLGLVHELVATPGEVFPRALAIAQELAAKPPRALSATRAWLYELRNEDERWRGFGVGSADSASHAAFRVSEITAANNEYSTRLAAFNP